jgi:hypothetical protein
MLSLGGACVQASAQADLAWSQEPGSADAQEGGDVSGHVDARPGSGALSPRKTTKSAVLNGRSGVTRYPGDVHDHVTSRRVGGWCDHPSRGGSPAWRCPLISRMRRTQTTRPGRLRRDRRGAAPSKPGWGRPRRSLTRRANGPRWPPSCPGARENTLVSPLFDFILAPVTDSVSYLRLASGARQRRQLRFPAMGCRRVCCLRYRDPGGHAASSAVTTRPRLCRCTWWPGRQSCG